MLNPGRRHRVCLQQRWPSQGPALWLFIIIKVYPDNDTSHLNPKAGFVII